MNTATSEELNCASNRRLYFDPQSNTLTGTISNQFINGNGWKYSLSVMNDFVKNYQKIYLYDTSNNLEITLKDVAGIIAGYTACSLVDKCGETYYSIDFNVKLLSTPCGKTLSILANDENWLKSHCFTLNGIGESKDGIVEELLDMRLYITTNEDILC